MLKNTLFVAGTVIATIAVASLPAAATGGLPTASDPEEVPEPMTILGSLAVGGGLIAKKIAGSKNSEE